MASLEDLGFAPLGGVVCELVGGPRDGQVTATRRVQQVIEFVAPGPEGKEDPHVRLARGEVVPAWEFGAEHVQDAYDYTGETRRGARVYRYRRPPQPDSAPSTE